MRRRRRARSPARDSASARSAARTSAARRTPASARRKAARRASGVALMGAPAGMRPLDDAARERLEMLLDAVPAPLDALDTGMLDGFLCGVIVQPEPVPFARWLVRVTDVDGRALPLGFDASEL